MERKGVELAYPFSEAEYEATCPEGHPVKMATGYCTWAPSWWIQWGLCETCQRYVERTVGMPHGQFAAGPTYWEEETSEEDRIWRHDVLDGGHRCERCCELAQIELASTLLAAIEEGAELAEVVKFLEEATT